MQRCPPHAAIGPWPKDHSIALPRHLHLVDVEAELLRQPDGLRIAGLKDTRILRHRESSAVCIYAVVYTGLTVVMQDAVSARSIEHDAEKCERFSDDIML
jgi:hypothetical protein